MRLPDTVDSSPIYLHGVTVAGAGRNVILLTTTYGKTITLNADSGAILWILTPPGYNRWAGSAQRARSPTLTGSSSTRPRPTA